MNRIWLILMTSLLSLSAVFAQEADSTRVFTKEHPLVYEDAWDLWPYTFLNEKGEPVGYNIDLLRMICKELNIPYRIKLKPTSDALNDLKAGQADLMCGMDAHFHNEYAQYGKTVLQLFTHSVVHQKEVPPVIHTAADLANNRVIVHTGSFSHHLMIERGWGDNAIPYDDMQEAVQNVHGNPNIQIVWNTLSLKWLIHKFQFDDLELTPVDVQHGEYKFMSNNPWLLHQFDSVYTILRSEDRLQSIQNKWFYPERQREGMPSWLWKVAAILGLIILLSLIYYIAYRLREKKTTKELRQSNSRLSMILNTSKVRIGVYNVKTKTVIIYDKDGHLRGSMLFDDFIRQIAPTEFERAQEALKTIISKKKKSLSFDIMAKERLTDATLRSFTVSLSVLHHGKDDKPINIIVTRSDITEEKSRQQRVKSMMLRYQAVSNSAMVDMVAYDEHGIITEMNDKAWRAFPGRKEDILASKISVSQVLGMEVDLDTMETIYVTQIYHNSPDDPRVLNRLLKRPEMYYELKLVPVRDEQGRLLAIYGAGRDVTEVAKSYTNLKKDIQLLENANREMSRYISNIDYVLKNGKVRIINYSPVNHILTFFSETDHAQYRLTQTRSIELTDEEYRKKAQRLLNNMDNLTAASINTTIKTTLRVNGISLFLEMSFLPTFDEEGNVVDYFGMCRDVSEIKATEAELEKETVRAQEVETLKNAFLHNMSYEIRTPLNSVVGFAELFEMDHTSEDETVFINEIKQSSMTLLKLINDILFLSRLDARMIEFKPKQVDFTSFFETRCQTGWFSNRLPGVTYTVESPYNRLVVEIDDHNLGIIIDQIVLNAVQHTTAGHVRARYDYTGETIVMTFQDTGCGIPEAQLEHIFDRFVTVDSHGSGLGLSICREIANQMDGRITIKSEEGVGTIVWVTIPCKVIELER